METLPSTSLTYQIFRCSIICTSLTTWIPRMALPSPPPSEQCWDEPGMNKHFYYRVKCTRVHELQHCLRKREKEGNIVLIVLRILSSIAGRQSDWVNEIFGQAKCSLEIKR